MHDREKGDPLRATYIDIQNFRLLDHLRLKVDGDLSVIVGRNNTGKTSIMAVMQKFLGGGESFVFDDFNNGFKQT